MDTLKKKKEELVNINFQIKEVQNKMTSIPVTTFVLNKEIADRLNIGLTTVISHRKNIMTKLGLRSVSALTIYAVMHGYINIDQI